MDIVLDFKGTWAIPPDEIAQQIDDEIKNRMNAAVQMVKKEAEFLLSRQGTGRQYKVPGTKDTWYTASSPGEPPAVVTGDLGRSIDTDVSDDGFEGSVGTSKDYGMMLQFGTKNILPRPWLDVAFINKLEELEAIFSQDWLQ
jgi:phage gpG-like protein